MNAMAVSGRHIAVALAVLFLLGFGVTAFVWFRSASLDAVHRSIERDFADVAHLTTASLAGEGDDNVVLFDVRAPEEYSVSHLDGAIRVDPDISVDAFIEAHGEGLAGKKVVFYCSVGRRSSILAARLDAALRDAEIASAYNLKGGIFQWSNENRRMVSSGGSTNAVHPYNEFWARYVDDKKAIRYTPKPGGD